MPSFLDGGAGSAVGGFAQGFAKGFSGARDRAADSANNRVEQRALQMFREQQQRNSDRTHKLQLRKEEIAKKKFNLDIAGKFSSIAKDAQNGNATGAAARLNILATSLGMDTNNPSFKMATKAITSSGETQLNSFIETITQLQKDMLKTGDPLPLSKAIEQFKRDPAAFYEMARKQHDRARVAGFSDEGASAGEAAVAARRSGRLQEANTLSTIANRGAEKSSTTSKDKAALAKNIKSIRTMSKRDRLRGLSAIANGNPEFMKKVRRNLLLNNDPKVVDALFEFTPEEADQQRLSILEGTPNISKDILNDIILGKRNKERLLKGFGNVPLSPRDSSKPADELDKAIRNIFK